MPKSSDLDRVTAIVLRFMHRPLVLLIGVYAVGIAGMVLMPGRDADGNPGHMSFFHAFYFMTYTATTTGFGELPYEFSEPQRMWATACLYMSVVAWVYAIGSIIRVAQNPHFTQALAQQRFSVAVSRIDQPFIIICGFGDTGSLLARGLSDRHVTGVIIDRDPERIKALALRDYSVKMPGLRGDAGVPKNLEDAGLAKPNCKAVVVLTQDEDINLKIAVVARLLNPAAEVICRSTDRKHEEELETLGSVVIADPFEAFARVLSLALDSPPMHTLDEWLIGARGVSLERPLACPMGTWILCGYGRMGKWLYEALHARGVRTVVIDPGLTDDDRVENKIVGIATESNLCEAGAAEAAGVVAATDHDSDNLAILLTARALNPDLFLVVRQNRHENEMVFNAAEADLIMQPSLVTARRILLRLVSPMIETFLDYMEAHEAQLLSEVYPRLREAMGKAPPLLWALPISIEGAPAAVGLLAGEHVALSVGDVVRDPDNREHSLSCVPLVLKHGAHETIMPGKDEPLAVGDELLLCGTATAQRLVDAHVHNPYTLEYLATGYEPARSYLLARLLGRRREAV